ncbi:MAG TPA: DUF2946 family protein [Methyloversatilis sp.]
MSRNSACIGDRRLRMQAFALICLFLCQFGLEALGGVLRTATPFDDVCTVAGSRSGGDGSVPTAMPSHGKHCALCASASVLPPPPLSFTTTETCHADVLSMEAGRSLHPVAAGAHWQSRAPPHLS